MNNMDIRNEVFAEVKAYAAARSISNGAAATELMKRGPQAEIPTRRENGLLVFDPGPAGAVTSEDVMRLKDAVENDFA